MKLSEFQRAFDFPTRGNVVYVFFYYTDDEAGAIPFYVGETGRFNGRMADYDTAAFAAATDFKVGEAIRYLTSRGARVKVGYNDCSDRMAALAEEERLIRLYTGQGVKLLNAMQGFNYRTADQESERKKVREYCDREIMKGTAN